MNYHNITKEDMLNGDGLRVVLWLAGCTHKCEGCQNPITWDINGGIPFDEDAKEELFDALNHDYIDGITLSGGDPLHPLNRDGVKELIKEIKTKFPNKTIWSYTGFSFEDVKDLDFIADIDVLVDGKFKKDLLSLSTPWVGSSNQRVIDIKQTLENNRIILHKE